jgi:phosphoribosylformylglycinamidine cyclo-ligase
MPASNTKEGERAVALMKQHVKKTFDRNVLTGLGSFGSLYKLPMEGITEPVLVSGTDGVGTKLKLAFMMNRHETVGIDCVAMCVNDILCQGATPYSSWTMLPPEKYPLKKSPTLLEV